MGYQRLGKIEWKCHRKSHSLAAELHRLSSMTPTIEINNKCKLLKQELSDLQVRELQDMRSTLI